MTRLIEDDYLWLQPAWKTRAITWIQETLRSLNISIIGDPEQFHITVWSTVMRVPTGVETIYFKAVADNRQFETHVTRVLANRHPLMMPTVLAIHPAEPWMLTRDMGSQFRISLRATGELLPLRTALPVFAEIQLQNIPHAQELIMLGAPERPVLQIPKYYEILLSNTSLLMSSDYALTAQQMDQLAALKPHIADMSAELAAGDIPLTIHHDDMHDANIFLKDGQICFSDWGDICVSHPFFSLLILLRSIADSLNCSEDDPRILDLRDIYLTQWTNYSPIERLRRQFFLAWRLGMINRAWSWFNDIRDYPEPYRSRYSYTVPGWLGDFLDTMNSDIMSV